MKDQPWPVSALGELLEWGTDPDSGRSAAAASALFGVVAEGLADLFEPRLALAYAEVFSQVIAHVQRERKAEDLVARYRRVREPHPFRGDDSGVRRVFVLSRVTLGADIAITSTALDALKRRFPRAEIVLVGGEKSRQLFEADPRIHFHAAGYGRGGTLRERLAVGAELRPVLSGEGSIVVDPDSRLTQLGLLPVCEEQKYFFFESRAYGGDGEDSLAELMRRWLAATFGVEDAKPYMAVAPAGEEEAPAVTTSLGVGENPAKRIADPFEGRLVRALAQRSAAVVIDKGAGAEEAARVERAIAGADPGRVRAYEGTFAGFAARIGRSRLYVGYDSAGQHAAAACGTPLVTVFAGHASPRMLARWHPTGPGPAEVVRVEDRDPGKVLERTEAAIDRLGVL